MTPEKRYTFRLIKCVIQDFYDEFQNKPKEALLCMSVVVHMVIISE